MHESARILHDSRVVSPEEVWCRLSTLCQAITAIEDNWDDAVDEVGGGCRSGRSLVMSDTLDT